MKRNNIHKNFKRNSMHKYVGVKNELKSIAMENDEGFKIASISELMQQYEMSDTTVTRAIRELVAEGYLCTVQGAGIYVSKISEKQSSAKSRNIGLIHTDQIALSYPWFMEVMRNVTFIARNQEYKIVIVLKENDHLFGPSSDRLIHDIEGGYYSGMLVADKLKIAEMNRLLEFEIPFVSIGNDYTNEELYLVTGDPYGWHKTINYCINKGRRNILYISGIASGNAHYPCLNAYRAAMEENELVFDEKNFVAGNWTDEAAYKIVHDRFTSEGDKPDAVVAEDGTLAHGAYCALKELHINVPEDVLIVQVNAIFTNTVLRGIVPYLDLQVDMQAREATKMLIRLINKEEVAQQKIYLKSSVKEPESGNSNTEAEWVNTHIS